MSVCVRNAFGIVNTHRQYRLHRDVLDHAVFREEIDWEVHLKYGIDEKGDDLYCKSGSVMVYDWVKKTRSLF